MTNLNEWYETGISKEEYMSELDTHKESFEHIYRNFEVPETDIATLQQHDGVRALVLAEVWCGHCMLDIPIFLNMTEKANIPVTFFRRDDNLELMDQYLTNEKRIIPIIIFIDKNGNELATWGPVAPKVGQIADEYKKDIPAKDDPAYEDAFKQFAATVSKLFTEDETIWQAVYEDIKETLITM